MRSLGSVIMDCCDRHLTLGLHSSLDKHPWVRLAILSIVAGVGDLPQSLWGCLWDSTILSQFLQFHFQLLDLFGIDLDHFLNFMLILHIVLIQSLIIFLQFPDGLILFLYLLLESHFFLLKRVMCIIQNRNHFLDFQLIPFDLKQWFINMLLFPFQNFFIFAILLPDSFLEKIDLFSVDCV